MTTTEITTADATSNAEVATVETPVVTVVRPEPTRSQLRRAMSDLGWAVIAAPVAGTALGLSLHGAPPLVQAGVSAAAVGIAVGASKLPIRLPHRTPSEPGLTSMYCCIPDCERYLGEAQPEFLMATKAPICPRCQADGCHAEILPSSTTAALPEAVPES